MVFSLFCMHMRYRIYRLNNTKLYRRGEEKEWQNKIKLHRQSKNQHTRLSPSLLTSHSCVVATALFLSRTFPPASQDIPPLICPVLPFHCSRGHVSGQPASQPASQSIPGREDARRSSEYSDYYYTPVVSMSDPLTCCLILP